MPLEQALHEAGPLLTLAGVLLAGLASGALARRLHLPGVTGQILAGVALGRAGLGLFDDDALHGLQPLTHLALGLMAVTVGAHLNVRRLRNAVRRLSILLLAEATVTPLLVFAAVWLLSGSEPEFAVLLAAVAIATAPATTVALVKETRSRGVFVKTLVAAVALNNMACIVLFELARATVAALPDGGPTFATGLWDVGRALALATAIGIGIAMAMDAVARFTLRSELLATASVVALVLAVGLADALGLSPLLTCLVLGLVQTNLTRTRNKLVDSVFEDFEPVILCVFFTLAGMHLSLEQAGTAGVLSLVYFGARVGGKLAAADLAMRLAQATERVRRNLGLALVPQAGVAVGFVILVQEDPHFTGANLFGAVVLTTVTINEIVGPILTRLALGRSGEVGKDRLRLIDFLHEENIVTDFAARSKEEAIERLVDLLIHSHHLDVDREALLESVIAREKEGSTCFGGGLAVPHGLLPDGHPMVGVMGLSRSGLDFETPDGRRVHCMVLLATAPHERDRHLQVLATLARTVGSDPAFQVLLFEAKSPAHADEILQGEASEDFNYFLAGDDRSA